MNEFVCNLVKSQSVVEINYGGSTRAIEPYCHGLTAKGKEVLLAYQITGWSASGKRAGWKILEVDKISQVHETDRKFSPRPDYNPDNPPISFVHCDLLVR